MKILHFSDIEGDKKTLDKLTRFAQKRDDLSVIVCSGDILGSVLSPEKIQEMVSAWKVLRERFSEADLILQENAEQVREAIAKSGDRRLLASARAYSTGEREFGRLADKDYSGLIKLFKQFPQEVLTVPGNWDPMSYFKHFAKFDIHKETRDIDDVEFGGYGGSLVTTTSPTCSIFYDESEFYEFLFKTIPEIAVTHAPPFGILDHTISYKHIGSQGLLKYLASQEGASNAVLCGHCHEDAGVVKANDTLVVNSGNLGKTQGIYSPTAGCFVVINYNTDTREVEKVTPYQVADDNEVYELNGKEKIRQEVA